MKYGMIFQAAQVFQIFSTHIVHLFAFIVYVSLQFLIGFKIIETERKLEKRPRSSQDDY